MIKNTYIFLNIEKVYGKGNYVLNPYFPGTVPMYLSLIAELLKEYSQG